MIQHSMCDAWVPHLSDDYRVCDAYVAKSRLAKQVDSGGADDGWLLSCPRRIICRQQACRSTTPQDAKALVFQHASSSALYTIPWCFDLNPYAPLLAAPIGPAFLPP